MNNESSYPPESLPMRCFRRLQMDSAAWSLRRLHCPVSRDALVLEVGSGGNPYPRANVLMDAYEETGERHWVPLITDRPFVFGFTEYLPFKTRAFDFVIASHVFEHSPNPERFLSELQRVAHGGYIETPDAFMERINPYPDHRLEITVRDGALVIRKKPTIVADEELVELYRARVKPYMTREFMRQRPFSFHMRYYWSEQIRYEIKNPTTAINWTLPAPAKRHPPSSLSLSIRSQLVTLARSLMSQRSRNRKINLYQLLRCPTCGSEQDLDRRQDCLICKACQTEYPLRNGIPIMYPTPA